MDKFCNECGILLDGGYIQWGTKKSGRVFYCYRCECDLSGCEFCEDIDKDNKRCHLLEEQHIA